MLGKNVITSRGIFLHKKKGLRIILSLDLEMSVENWLSSPWFIFFLPQRSAQLLETKMFNIFKKSKTQEVTELVRLGLGNSLMTAGMCKDINDPSLGRISEHITKSWLESLPKAAINECQRKVLAAYILVAESQVYAKEKSTLELAILYIDAARLVTRGIGLGAIAGQLHDSDCKLLMIMAKLANKAGLNFNDELLEING